MRRRPSIDAICAFVVVSGLLAVPGCSGGGNMLGGGTQTVLLAYDDGQQVAAPNTAAGTTWEAGARFTAAETGPLAGGLLTEVRFFIVDVPGSASVKIYDAGTVSTPGTVLYSADVTSGITGADWNTHVLATPVPVTGDDLWISIEFSPNPNEINVIGCDAGPADPNGRWLFDSANWSSFAANVNWNVRGVVEVPI